METVMTDIERLSREDRARIQRIVENQRPMSDDEWKQQVKAHAQVGRDTKSALPFWRRWMFRAH